MGTINFVHRFILDFTFVVKSIYIMLKQDHPFSWTDDVEKDFIRRKKEISFSLVLVKPYFEKDFIIYTNATKEAISAILMQNDEQKMKNL
jgi:hypothetical protein